MSERRCVVLLKNPCSSHSYRCCMFRTPKSRYCTMHKKAIEVRGRKYDEVDDEQ